MKHPPSDRTFERTPSQYHSPDALDLRLTHALEQAPYLLIPDDFAAKVAAAAPHRSLAPPERHASFGRQFMFFAMAALIVMMLLVSVFATRQTSIVLALEYGFALELTLLITFTSLRPSRLD